MRGWAVVVLLAAGATARAQETDGGVVVDGGGEMSAQDLRDLEAALARDMQQGATNGGPTSGSPFVLGSSEAPPRPSMAGPSVFSLPSAGNIQADVSFIGDVSFAVFSNDQPLQQGGHDPSKNGFNMQGLEMAVGAAVDPFFRADGSLVFTPEGVEVEEIFATTTSLPFRLQARVGKFLTRFGRVNTQHLHSWDFLDSPMVWAKVWGGDGNRGVGTELSWLAPTPWYMEFVASANDAAGGETARTFLNESSAWVKDPRMLQFNAALRQFFPLGDSLSLALGFSGATGPHHTGSFDAVTARDAPWAEGDTARRVLDETGAGDLFLPRVNGADHRAEVAGVDVYFKWRPVGASLPSWRLPLPGRPAWAPTFDMGYQVVSLTTEWLVRRRQVPGGVIVDHGAYTQLFWRFHKLMALGLRAEYGSGVPLSYVGGDPVDPEWTTWRVRGTAAFTFWPSEFSRIRAQYSVDRPFWRASPTHAVMVGMEFSIGAHGAHAF